MTQSVRAHPMMPGALLLLTLVLGFVPARAAGSGRMNSSQIPQALRTIHRGNPGTDQAALGRRMAAVSALFLGMPYRLGPLGEGSSGEFNRNPHESLRFFDCTTLVEETMALALEPDFDQALAVLQKIRYKDGRVSYASRNHFPEADWIPNNVKAGYLEDITRRIAGAQTKVARKTISKRAWYAAKTETDLKGFGPMPEAQKTALLARLRASGRGVPDETAALDYLPIEDLPVLIAKIPTGTIANLVRGDDPKALPSSQPTMVTHQVLIIVKDGKPYVRHAAYGKFVEDVPARDYFKRYEHSKRRLLGLNLLELRKPK